MDIIESYSATIIKPIEEEVKRLRNKVNSHNFYNWLYRDLNKKDLEKKEKILLEKYKRLETMMQVEIDFQSTIKKELN